MSFSDEDILEEIASSVGGRREYFSADSFSFRRLGKVETLDPALMNAFYWRQWRAANPERARSYVAAYLARDPAKKRAMKQARKRRWQQKNRDRYNALQRAAYARHSAKKAA